MYRREKKKDRYMNKSKRKNTLLLKVSISVLIIIIAVFSLTSCGLDKEFVAGRIEECGVPEFDYSKLKGVEMVYRDYYVEELPDVETLTEKTSEIYFEKYHTTIDTADKVAVTDALIDSYIEVIGDRYSIYRSAEEYEDYGTDMSGSFYGIGVTVTYDSVSKTMTVTDVSEGGGAYDAGILVGDVVIKVGSENIADLEYDDAVNKIRGELNTRVEITVLRDGAELPLSVTRKKVVESSVTYSIDENKIGYVKISSFKSNTYAQFKEAIGYMQKNGAVGIVYDLRSNPGGWLTAVVDILSYIAPTGTEIVSFTNDYAPSKHDNNIHSLSLPSVVICNGSTASAGELFTAAMRDFADRGYFDVTIVGETTFGKGIMQSTYEFTDKSAITLTVAYYNPPSGVNYHGVGIVPDVAVSMTDNGDAQLDAAYDEILKLIIKK